MKNGKTIAIVPGSFDPITVGHLDIIRRAIRSFDEVIVAVMINDSKKYMFDIEERTEIVRAAVAEFEGVSVVSSEGMLWQLCRDLKVDAIVKGYRNQVDYEYEMLMAEYNEKHCPSAKTVLLKSDPALDHISSTLVRQKILGKADLDGLVPSSVIKKINDIITSDKI